MRRLERLPEAFDRFQSAHGALDFAIFENAQNDPGSQLAAIRTVVPDLDNSRLLSLGSRRISDGAFFGSWYDTTAEAVVHPGGAYGINMPGSGGDFARAFLAPPYNLWKVGREAGQATGVGDAEAGEIFHSVRRFILPPDLEHDILDWAHPELPEVADYFAQGMEWWGVFLFTIHVPALNRLTAIAGSTTD